MIEELYCQQCDNDDSFIVEYHNTLMDSQTTRDVMINDEFQQMLDRGLNERHIVRVDCTECAETLYNS